MATGGSVWRAMAGNPLRFVLSPWPWRCLAYLSGTVAFAGAVWGALLAGVLFPPALLLIGVPVGVVERWRLRLLGQAPASPHAAAPAGLVGWLRRRLGERATWRELGYTLCLASALVVTDLVGLFALAGCGLWAAAPAFVATSGRTPFPAVDTAAKAWTLGLGVGLLAFAVVLYALCVLAAAQATFARWLLAPSDTELGRRVEELDRSRARLVNAFEAERRRIERDLHDGAQQHLVLLSMTLGLAAVELADDGGRARALVVEAREQARQAQTEIRELIHGIHPQVLTDLGLRAAVGELAERCPLPVEVEWGTDTGADAGPGRRPPAAVESTAYFVVCEAVTNAVRHARARRVTVAGRVAAGRLLVTVTDDGVGGADPARGSGLRGLVDRVAVMAGNLVIISPIGGPTSVRLELPCRYA
ncbi:MAG TPA: histidine kinase [Mycobacteriales bacterium]|nr:histidine kinase [Mycobacteriales bacterium]